MAGKIVVASGYFDPIHVGHLRYLREARRLGSQLWVIVNNDQQAKLKKGKPFMRAVERAHIVGALKWVDQVRVSFDTDETVKETLEWITHQDPWGFIFAKGGDSTKENTPETTLCEKLGIEVEFFVGGAKVQSSSWLINGSSE